jgi:putative ABC transport system permease protein
MRIAHRLRPGSDNDFTIDTGEGLIAFWGKLTKVIFTVVPAVVVIGIVVGGIVIMNIMLMSVTERTREIGIRKALGATRQTILLQFLAEAMVLCIAGGAVGVAIGTSASAVLRRSFGWDTSLSPAAIVLAFTFAGAVGILFGVWPARRAAVLDPITALRYE